MFNSDYYNAYTISLLRYFLWEVSSLKNNSAVRLCIAIALLYIFKKIVGMKKVPSYPKISSKATLPAPPLNINSPKALPHYSHSKKLFRHHKGSMQARQDSELRPSLNKSKLKDTQKQDKPRRQSAAHNKLKSQDAQQYPSKKDKPEKHDIRKIEEKLKELEKKIDTLRHTKKKKDITAKRSHSKIKQTQVTTVIQHKASLGSFKKKEPSLQKVLKKTQSDKYLMRPPTSKPVNNPMTMSSQQQSNDEKLIHKFVTQVTRSQMEGNKMYSHKKGEKTVCYYIQSAVQSIHKNYLLPFREHLAQSVQTIKYLKHNRKPTSKQIEKHSVILPNSKHKYSLVLDLDQTLIHCNENLSLPHDVTLKIKFPTGEKIDAGVNMRPFAKELLKQLSKICEIIVFTASHQCYANVVLDYLDPKCEFVSHRLFRGHCWQTEEGVYIKDLRVLKNRRLENVLLVDNAAYSYFYQLQNGIPIIPFYDDKDDQQLLNLIQYVKDLIEISQQQQGSTLQQLNHRYFQLSSYMHYEDIQILTSKLYKQTVTKHKKMIH